MDAIYGSVDHVSPGDASPLPVKSSIDKTMSEDEDSSGWQLTESDPGVFTYVCLFSFNYSPTQQN